MSERSSYKYKGEKLSFFELFTLKGWDIQIPIIQRDYAQGRKSTVIIRDDFLCTLFEHLQQEDPIDLDFIYGSLSGAQNKIFVPLDGQQRLTTLFLLHWYLACKEERLDFFKDIFLHGGFSRFSYKTRTTSSEFCDQLVKEGLSFQNLLPADDRAANSISKSIKDTDWYFFSWDNDPTIQSMLNMLDSIHERFMVCNGFLDKLISQAPLITFQFLNLKEFNLTDDLYIKMNSRGKQLTPFENFKAKLEKLIKAFEPNDDPYKFIKGGAEQQVSLAEYFSQQIDTEWANLFWNYCDSRTMTYDVQLMNFLRVVITNYYGSLDVDDDDFIDNLKMLIGKELSEEDEFLPITYSQYAKIEVFTLELINDIVAILDKLKNGDDCVRIYADDAYYFDEKKVFEKTIKNSLSYTERLQFFAFYKYLIVNDSLEGLKDWTRVIFNLTENTIYNRISDFQRALKGINELLPQSSKILEYLSNKDNPVNGFLELQVIEERVKSALFLKNQKWVNEIVAVEKHEYFKGQIGFILSFSQIEDYYIETSNCNWTEKEDRHFLERFKDYVSKAKSVFTSAGLVLLPDFLWERALLSKGDYLLYNKSNYSFLVDNDRDISWKRLLRDKNDGSRDFVRQVFDDPLFITADVKSSLKKIIKSSTAKDWTEQFINQPGVLAYLGEKKYIRWVSPEKIYLLTKERISGLHADYYSYAFYLKYRDKEIEPFGTISYHEVSGDEDEPYCLIQHFNYRKHSYYVSIFGESEGLKIYFSESRSGKIPDDISSILVNLQFELSEKTYFKSVKTIPALTKVFEKLRQLLIAL